MDRRRGLDIGRGLLFVAVDAIVEFLVAVGHERLASTGRNVAAGAVGLRFDQRSRPGGFSVNQPGYGTPQVLESGSKMDSGILPVVRASRPLRVRLLRAGILLVIFCAGSIAGYCVGTMQLIEQLTQTETPSSKAYKTPEKFTEWLLAQWKKDLSLTDEQYPVVEKIVRRHHEAFDRIRREVQPKFAREMATMDREMRLVLNDSQKVLWEKRMEWTRNHRHRSPSGGGPSRGPSKDDSKFAQPDKRPPGEWSRDRSGNGRDHRAPSREDGAQGAPPEKTPPK